MTEPMTRERERALIALAQGGDESAQEEMIRQWLPFVHGQLSRWSTFSARVDRDDLMAVGMAAIFRNTMKFDLDSDNGFGAYVVPAIYHAMQDEARMSFREFIWHRPRGDDPLRVVSLDSGGDGRAIDLDHDEDDPVDQAMRREVAEVVREVCRSELKGAPSRYLWMHAIDERLSIEIAERYHISQTAVCAAIREAHDRLRKSPRLRELAS